jgi:hypothetical protein
MQIDYVRLPLAYLAWEMPTVGAVVVVPPQVPQQPYRRLGFIRDSL